ncbi:class I SAM-dependent methyltransferase [Nocardioides sp. GCM10027113]|uniref:class I SAM-dependent methyltransferase n=1 Tax=unclassified Nocardioides TaxID=2615069 RepID=UPI00360771CB
MQGLERTPQQALAEVYDAGAEAYEKYWAPELHRHARDLVSALPTPDRPRTVLDVAAGTGALLGDLRRAAGEGGAVVALDRSLGMLRRVPGGTPRVQADAVQLPLAKGCADVAVLSFMLFLLPDARTGVAEVARVLRPGGWLLAATWGTQVSTAADVAVREELDRVGAPVFDPPPRSDEETNTVESMAALLDDHFTEVSTTPRSFDGRFSAETALALRTRCGSLGWRFAQLGREAQTEVVARVEGRLAAVSPEDLHDHSEVLLTVARRR